MNDTRAGTRHHRTERRELGYVSSVCAECDIYWPCTGSVMEQCERIYLAAGLPCNCSHHQSGMETQEADR